MNECNFSFASKHRNHNLTARFTTSGEFDASFGTNGRLAVPLWAGYHEFARAVTIQDNERIVVAGYGGFDYSGHNFLLLRLLSNGVKDTSFHTDGIVGTPIGTSASRVDVYRSATSRLVIVPLRCVTWAILPHGWACLRKDP